MKQTFFFIISCTLCITCSRNEVQTSSNQSIVIATIMDVTDKKILWPTFRTIAGLFDWQNNTEAECQFSLTVISEKVTNPTFSAFLPNAKITEAQNKNDDMQYRKKRVLEFNQQVKNIIDTFYIQFDTSKTQAYSECWVAVCKSLEGLAMLKSDKKVLLIYSDLLENSLINSYNLTPKSNIETIAKSLNKLKVIPEKLLGITVVVIYNPMNRQDDIRFNKTYEAYKSLLEKNGAIVKQQADNGVIKL